MLSPLPEIAEISPAEALALEALPPLHIAVWAERAGQTPATVKAWVESGYLRMENVNGQWFIPAAETVQFNRRMRSGEFGKIKPPRAEKAK